MALGVSVFRCYCSDWILTDLTIDTDDSVIALEGHAVAAAHWIVVAGRELYDGSEDIKTEWTTWKADLAWILERDGLRDDVKAKVQEARIVMDMISA